MTGSPENSFLRKLDIRTGKIKLLFCSVLFLGLVLKVKILLLCVLVERFHKLDFQKNQNKKQKQTFYPELFSKLL